MSYSINYREYNDKNLLEDNYDTGCFSNIFSYGVKDNTTHIILYVSKLFISEEKFVKWVNAVNNAGYPCKYEGLSTDEHLKWLNLENTKYHIVSVPIAEHKNSITFLTSTLSIVRAAYDASGHMGKDPHKICEKYFEICEVLPDVDDFTRIMMAHAMYGRGAGHLIHNLCNFRLFTLENFLKEKPENDIITKGGRYLHITYNKFATFDNVPQDIKEYYNLLTKKPEEKVTKVYVVGNSLNYANWLPNTKVVPTLEESDLVLFTGGEDVTPAIYGDVPHPRTGNNISRDNIEQEIFQKAKDLDKKMLGICRGSQFLCAMSGGKLVQDQSNPQYIHRITLKDGREIDITSTHHQAQYPFNMNAWDYDIIGWSKDLSPYHQDGNCKELNPPVECEIVHYKKTKALAIQGHPEHEEYQRYHKDSADVLKEIFTNFINDKL